MKIECTIDELLDAIQSAYERGFKEGGVLVKGLTNGQGPLDVAKLREENEKLRACRDACVVWRKQAESFNWKRSAFETQGCQGVWDAAEPFMQEAAQ